MEPMTAERRAEIRQCAALIAYCIEAFGPNMPEVHRAELLDEVDRLTARVSELTDKVIAAKDAQVDAAALQRENAELRQQCADVPTTDAAVALLRKWVPDYEVGATHVSMTVRMARRLLAEVDKDARWEPEDQSYEVLLGNPLWSNAVVYDECDTPGSVDGALGRVFAEIGADELEGPVYTRRITRQIRGEQP